MENVHMFTVSFFGMAGPENEAGIGLGVGGAPLYFGVVFMAEQIPNGIELCSTLSYFWILFQNTTDFVTYFCLHVL
jgi:hypothetical protein